MFAIFSTYPIHAFSKFLYFKVMRSYDLMMVTEILDSWTAARKTVCNDDRGDDHDIINVSISRNCTASTHAD